MTQNTREGTDNAQATRILAGLRERVQRLEKRDRHADNVAHGLRVTSETVQAADVTLIEVTETTGSAGFGDDPFGSNFGSPSSESGDSGGTSEPIATREIQNTTTQGFQQFVAEAAHISTSPTPLDLVALGDGTGTFSVQNQTLHNRFGDAVIFEASMQDSGRTAVLHAELDGGQYVGETIRELGVVDEDNRLINHAPVDPAIEKTADTEVSIEVRLRVRE